MGKTVTGTNFNMFGVGLLKIVAFSWAWGTIVGEGCYLECVFLFVGSFCKASDAGGEGGDILRCVLCGWEDVVLVGRPSTVEAGREQNRIYSVSCGV